MHKWGTFYDCHCIKVTQLFIWSCLYCTKYVSISFHCRIQANLFLLLLKAVSDTSICMVSRSERADKVSRQCKKNKKNKNSINLLRCDSSCWLKQSISTNSLRYQRLTRFPLSTSGCLPATWQAHNNRSHMESFEIPLGLCLVKHTHTQGLPAPPCLPSHLSSALRRSLQALPLDLDLMKLQKTD